MKKDIIKLQNLSLIFFLILLYLSLIIGFQLNEDSNGGAFLDYKGQKSVSEAFATNFKQTFLNYDNFATRHSPVLIIFLSFFEKLNYSDELIRIIHLHISLILPISFYLILIEKFQNIERKYLIVIVGLVFFSPTFRSLSIWPDSRLLGLGIFNFSILFFLYFLKTNKLKYCILNITFCALSAYISPNFSVFSIYFFYFFAKRFGFLDIKILFVIFYNIILSLPAFYYIFILDINFLTKTAVIANKKNLLFFENIANQILIIPTIIFFYFIPFLLTKFINLNFKKIKFKIIICLFVLLISVMFFDYKYDYTGGGIFFKASNFLFDNNYTFYLISFISLIFLLILCSNKFENYLIIFLIFLSNPQVSIYHKYYDPFLIIIMFSLINLRIDTTQFKNIKKNFFIYLYFVVFLIIGIVK
ncbi:MAG: hypothetical protein CBB97_06570 [Candidatus Endolissoclinum sp. TMED37]|nr:MAG: hypothetical protein CBB97_06570 [Candidatus Endolissoclinum sp. TMED37]